MIYPMKNLIGKSLVSMEDKVIYLWSQETDRVKGICGREVREMLR